MSRPLISMSARSLATLLPSLQLAPGPVYHALADSITALVRDGRVTPETRLPSERELASELDLSRATVTAAYDRLREHGLLISRPGAGSFVTIPVTDGPRSGLARWSMPPSAAPFGVEQIFDLSCAAMPAPPGVLEHALAEAAGRLPELAAGAGYDPMGLPALRRAVSDRFSARGVPTDPEQILITSGALHAFDLLLRLLTGPGDRVLTELPSYPGALDAIRANSARVVPVPMAADRGWDLAAMQAALRQTSPRLAYLIPDYHNPTGAFIAEQQRRDLLRVARATATVVVVDESFVHLGLEPDAPDPAGSADRTAVHTLGAGSRRPTAALDPSVVTIGSLSKPVWGGLRIGWIRASVDLVRRLGALRATTDMTGSALDQLVGVALFERFDAIIEARRQQLRPQRDALLAALARELPTWQTAVPAGGLSAWVELDLPMATPLSLIAAQLGVYIVPGSRFGVDGTLERFLRMPFALPPEELTEAVRRLALAWSQLAQSSASVRPMVFA